MNDGLTLWTPGPAGALARAGLVLDEDMITGEGRAAVGTLPDRGRLVRGELRSHRGTPHGACDREPVGLSPSPTHRTDLKASQPGRK
jgi:hypothetical protein